MQETEEHRCAGCTAAPCHGDNAPHDTALRGGRLILTSLAFFLVPLILAVAGAICGRASANTQLAGALAGLVLGALGFALLARVFAKKEPA